METLKFLYENPPEWSKFTGRKFSIDGGREVISGMIGCGKSAILGEFASRLESSSYLWLNLDDLRVERGQVLANLEDFLGFHGEISTLIIDGAKADEREIYEQISHEFELKNFIIATRQKSLRLADFEHIQILPLDFEEFLAFDKKSDESAIFGTFFQNGNSPSAANLGIANAQKNLKSALSLNQIAILKECAPFVHKIFSPNQAYVALKGKIKISKDTIYRDFAQLQDEGIVHLIGRDGAESGAKRLYFGDFIYADALSLQKDLPGKFANAVFCELLKFGAPIFFTRELDFFVPSRHLGVLVVPFSASEFIILRFRRILPALKRLGIVRLQVITMANSAVSEAQGIKCEILPFYRFALGL